MLAFLCCLRLVVLPWGADRDELISSLTCVPGAEVVGLGPPSMNTVFDCVCLVLTSSCFAPSVVIAVFRVSSAA